jgi:glutaredoxin-related protein
MTRPLFPASQLHPEAAQKMASFFDSTLREVSDAIASNDVVVVGMAQNPFVKKARAALTEAGISFKYLEYGSYLSEWKRRLAIKMWSGWPTFPQIYVRGKLLGGFDLTKSALADGSFKTLLSEPRAS